MAHTRGENGPTCFKQKYSDNTISFKLDFDDDYTPLLRPRHAIRSIAPTTVNQSTAPTMYKESLPIKGKKFVHLQQLKKVLLPDHHRFYDSLRHICKGQCIHLIEF